MQQFFEMVDDLLRSLTGMLPEEYRGGALVALWILFWMFMVFLIFGGYIGGYITLLNAKEKKKNIIPNHDTLLR